MDLFSTLVINFRTIDTTGGEETNQDDYEEDEGERKGEKKSGKLTLSVKKKKDAGEKKKLRMFSPRKFFDKDRSKAAPDGTRNYLFFFMK